MDDEHAILRTRVQPRRIAVACAAHARNDWSEIVAHHAELSSRPGLHWHDPQPRFLAHLLVHILTLPQCAPGSEARQLPERLVERARECSLFTKQDFIDARKVAAHCAKHERAPSRGEVLHVAVPSCPPDWRIYWPVEPQPFMRMLWRMFGPEPLGTRLRFIGARVTPLLGADISAFLVDEATVAEQYVVPQAVRDKAAAVQAGTHGPGTSEDVQPALQQHAEQQGTAGDCTPGAT